MAKYRVYASPKIVYVSKPGPKHIWVEGHWKINKWGKRVWVPSHWKKFNTYLQNSAKSMPKDSLLTFLKSLLFIMQQTFTVS
jgi:hypothetical protein